jgi:hypothetical protein
MADGSTRERAQRLAQIRAETACKLGHANPESITGPDRERLELASALVMQRELETARMLAGHTIGADALVKLSEAISAVLPAASPVTARGHFDVARLNDQQLEQLEALYAVAWVEGEPTPEEQRLRELRQEMERISASMTDPGVVDSLVRAEAQERQLRDQAVAKAAELEDLVRDLEAQLWRQEHPDPPARAAPQPAREQPGNNVIPMRSGGG